MPPIEDDKKLQVIDDGLPSTGRSVPSPTLPPTCTTTRARRDSSGAKKLAKFDELLARIPVTWKALTLVATIFVTGAVGHSSIIEYTKKYASKEELANHAKHILEVQEQIQALREADAIRAADIMSIKTDTSAVREDIRTLLQVMLNNPPSQHAPDKPRKR